MSSFKDILQKSFWNLEAAVCRCSTISMFLKITKTSKKNSCATSYFQSLQPASISKKRLQHWNFPGFCESFVIFKNNFFKEHLCTVASMDVSEISGWLLLKTSRSEDFLRRIIKFSDKKSQVCLHSASITIIVWRRVLW